MEKEIIRCIRNWLEGKPMPPYQLEINPTNKCNLNCLHCKSRGKPYYDSKAENRMTPKIYATLIRESVTLGVEKIHLSGGGEPLSAKKTQDIMQIVKKYRLYGSIVTNGSLFTKNLIKKLIKISWDNILYSIDGPDSETHDLIRNKIGVFNKAIKSINLFNSYKTKFNKNFPTIEMCLVLNDYNYNKIRKYIQLAYSLNIKKIFIQPIRVNDNKLGKKLLLNETQQREFKGSIKMLLKEAAKLNVETNLHEFDDQLIEKSSDIDKVIESYMQEKDNFSSLPCYSPWYFMGIRPNGDVYPCGVDSPKPFGNILHNSLQDIWYGKSFNNFRKRLLKKDLPSFCRECCGMTVLITKDIQKNLSVS